MNTLALHDIYNAAEQNNTHLTIAIKISNAIIMII